MDQVSNLPVRSPPFCLGWNCSVASITLALLFRRGLRKYFTCLMKYNEAREERESNFSNGIDRRFR